MDLFSSKLRQRIGFDHGAHSRMKRHVRQGISFLSPSPTTPKVRFWTRKSSSVTKHLPKVYGCFSVSFVSARMNFSGISDIRLDQPISIYSIPFNCGNTLKFCVSSMNQGFYPLFVKESGSNLGSYAWSMLPLQYTSNWHLSHGLGCGKLPSPWPWRIPKF